MSILPVPLALVAFDPSMELFPVNGCENWLHIWKRIVFPPTRILEDSCFPVDLMQYTIEYILSCFVCMVYVSSSLTTPDHCLIFAAAPELDQCFLLLR